MRPSWVDALCATAEQDLWFPDVGEGRGGRNAYAPAREVCLRCPRIVECAVLGAREVHGMWGGLTPRDRQRVWRARSVREVTTDKRDNAVVVGRLNVVDPQWFVKMKQAQEGV